MRFMAGLVDSVAFQIDRITPGLSVDCIMFICICDYFKISYVQLYAHGWPHAQCHVRL